MPDDVVTPEANIAHMLWHCAAQHGDRPAVFERERVTTYAELSRRAEAVNARLIAAGVCPGDRVAILLNRGADAAAGFFGVVSVGGVAINLGETLKPRQIEHILAHADARVLLTTADVLRRLPRALATGAMVLDVASFPNDKHRDPARRDGLDAAQIVYTSGSTGLPKGVAISHANLWASTRAVTSYLGVQSDDRIASLLPFSFTYGFNQLLCAAGNGASLIVERSPLPQQIVATMRAQRATIIAAVPPLWLQLLTVSEFRESQLAELRVMTNAGGRIPVDAVRELRRAQPQAKLFLMYGMTETIRATYLPPEEVDRRPDSIGRAIPGAEILVVREDRSLCDDGEVGELVQRGPTVALGYWNDPEATARVFRVDPSGNASERMVFSGDLVRRDADGFLYHIGRKDRMIKTLGHRVSPDEVVDALYASHQIVEAIIWTEPDANRGEALVACVVLAERGSLEELRNFCRLELPRYMQPVRIEVVSAIPRTSSGKHDVAAARAASEQEQAVTPQPV